MAQQMSGELGLDLAAIPRYEGAASYRVLPLPVLQMSARTLPYATFFIQGLNSGIAFPVMPSVSAGLLFGVGLGRKQDDAAILNGLGDIDTSFQYGLFARWHSGPASAEIRFLQSAHAGYGNHVTLTVAYAVLQRPRDHVTVSADTVWQNGPAQQTYFGIDSAQAASSTAGLPVYNPSPGVSRVAGKVAWEHYVTPHWTLRSAVGVSSIAGDAGDSPIVQRRTSVFGAVGVAYRF